MFKSEALALLFYQANALTCQRHREHMRSA